MKISAYNLPGGGTEVSGLDVARVVWRLLQEKARESSVYNCSNLYITYRDITVIVQRITGASEPLPTRPESPPQNVMSSKSLSEYGHRIRRDAIGGRYR